MDWSELEAVYERYHQRLYRYCFSIVGNADDAQDALQNAMLKAVRALPGEKREIQLKPWLYRIAHNESVELLRRRREQIELGPELASPTGGPAETADQRQRLRRLLGDLEQLPERQRGALVMRELGGLGFEQIGEAFGTSAAVVRQTVYEARLSLRQLEAGREMSCDKVMRELSDADGRIARRRDIQAHLRDCRDCRDFGESISARRHDLAAIAPLPAAASAALLHSVLAGGKAGAGLGGGIVAGAGKTAAGSLALKSAATVAVVAVLGASVADRSGLIDITGPNGSGGDAARVSGESSSAPQGTPAGDDGSATGAGDLSGGRPAAKKGPDQSPNPGTAGATGNGTSPNATAPGSTGELPAASSHGQETAAAHGGGRAQAGSKARGGAKGNSGSHAHSPSGPAGHSKGHPESPPQSKGHPESPGNPGSGGKEGSTGNAGAPRTTPAAPAKDVGPDNSAKAPFQPSETPKETGPPAK
jgi:RNA polymerase sigma factor (sigma-70 family)